MMSAEGKWNAIITVGLLIGAMYFYNSNALIAMAMFVGFLGCFFFNYRT